MAIAFTAGYTFANSEKVTPIKLNTAQTGLIINMASDRLLGRTTASAGAVEELTVGANLSLSAGVLALAGAVDGVTIGGVTPGVGTFTALTATGVVRGLALQVGTAIDQNYGVFATGSGSRALHASRSSGGGEKTWGWGDGAGDATEGTWALVNFSDTTTPTVQVTTAGLTLAGVLTLGTGPTTVSDSAGKILSAALNTVAVANGGTGATSAANARTSLGLVIGTNVAPATSGSSILYGNGSGGFSSVNVGSGLSFAGGTLSATGGGGSVTSVSVTTANGVSGSVATSTTTPAITLTLGAITPTSVTASSFVQGSEIRVAGTKVVGAQAGAIADLNLSTTLNGFDQVDASVLAQNFVDIGTVQNTLLAALRTHGLLAT